MGLVDLEAGDGEARAGVPPGSPRRTPHPTRDRGRASAGRRPPRELHQRGDRDPRTSFVPRHELQFTGSYGLTRVHGLDREPLGAGRPSRPSEGEAPEALRTLGFRRDLRLDRGVTGSRVMSKEGHKLPRRRFHFWEKGLKATAGSMPQGWGVPKQ